MSPSPAPPCPGARSRVIPRVSPQHSWPKGPAQLKPGRGPAKPELHALTQGGPQLPQTFPQFPNPQLTQTWTSSLCLAWGHTRTLTSPCWGFRGSRKGPGQLEHTVLRSFLATQSSLQALLLCSSLPLTWGAHHAPSYHPPLLPSRWFPYLAAQ